MYEKNHGHVALAGALSLTALIYLPVLANYPVADSWIFLVQRSFIETAEFFTRTVIPEEWNALWFRPLPMFTFWLDTILWKGDFRGPHLTNLIIHLANTILIWILIRIPAKRQGNNTIANVIPAFIAALIYGIHPLCVGAVAWIAARFDLLFVTFGLGALIMWERWREQPDGRVPVLCLVLLAGSLLSKEQGIVFIAIIIVSAVYMMLTHPKDRNRYPATVGTATGITVGYFIYRLMIFKGMGGYLDSVQMLSLKTPIGYFAALLFPYPNLAPQWRATLSLAIAVIMLPFLTVYLWSRSSRETGGTRHEIVISVLLLVFGLATTAPHAGLAFVDILGHIESRFALVAVTGMALTIGRLLTMYGRSLLLRRIALVTICLWGISALWRTDVQISAWHASGETARQIVDTVVGEIPDPVPGSVLFFYGIPSYSEQYTYIFGIGLKEALMRHYPGRNDFLMYPRAVTEELRQARPDIDAVFRFNREKWMLERLRPQTQ